MNPLSLENCVTVQKNMSALPAYEINELLGKVNGWQLSDKDGEMCITKTYKFSDFAEALIFTNLVGKEAEDQNHHPALLTEWGKVTVTWWTHVLHGLHRNDFVMAARTDALFQK